MLVHKGAEWSFFAPLSPRLYDLTRRDATRGDVSTSSVENSVRLESAPHLTGQIDGAARQKGAD